MTNKIKIKFAFDPTNYWDNLFFREFITAFVEDKENYEVYLVTLNTDGEFIDSVVTETGIDANTNVYVLPNNTAIVAKLNTLQTLIFLAEDNVVCNLVNATIPIMLVPNNVTGCQALVLNNIVDPWRVQQKFITFFHFWVDQINKQYPDGKAC